MFFKRNYLVFYFVYMHKYKLTLIQSAVSLHVPGEEFSFTNK